MKGTVRAKVAIAAAIAVLALPASALAKELMPGVGYERDVVAVDGRQVVIHSVTAPMPGSGGLYELRPVLSGGTITGRETVTAMQRSLASVATVVGVNGDYSSFLDGHPTGIVMNGGVLFGRPTGQRSSLGIGPDGLLRIGRISFFGTWTIGDMQRRPLDHLNRPLGRGEVGLFTPAWGAETPEADGAVDIVVTGLSSAIPNTDLAALVSSVTVGGGTPIPRDGAVLQAKGKASNGLRSVALPGVPFAVKLILRPWWPEVQNAIGGGPALVRQARLAVPTTEGFTASQLVLRAPRTAVGQLADGRIVLLVADGRSSASAGLTIRQLAGIMLARGVVTAMALDGGGSSVLAFDGDVLNSPSDGSERRIGNSLMFLYYGVYAPPPLRPVVSPNGDGVADVQRLSYRIVRPSTISAQLMGPGGKVVWTEEGAREPGRYAVPARVLSGLAEGRWRLVVRAIDKSGAQSDQTRTFSVNNTLGHLSLSSEVVRVGKRRQANLGIEFELDRAATVDARILDSSGATIRTILAGQHRPAKVQLSWNGLTRRAKPARPGRYQVVVRATNAIGKVGLSQYFTVRRP